MRLDILSDPICPWCYIGKKNLEDAMSQRSNHPFEIQWHPFQLNPDMPKAGMDRREYLETKFGGQKGAIDVYGQIDRHAQSVGLNLDFGAIKRTPNTLDAHRLIHWSGFEGKQYDTVDALFQAYFLEGRDIGESEVLADIADAVGLDASAILKMLNSDTDLASISERDSESRKMGVNSVPTFIVGGQHAVPGAQPTDLWIKVIDEVTGKDEPVQ
jgi:predicted DsbA family dithiol-disulfide isomerase